jgi:HPt (histidine-containing phosphotransfer) domain-containing protein
VALTANAVVGARAMFLENSFNDFMSKPIDMGRLNTILEKWIPKSKQKGFTAKDDALFLTKHADFEIEGLDVANGILRSGETVEAYLDALSAFLEDGDERIVKIKECLETKNWSLYTTHVHGLKSATGFIGALKLSKTAEGLEQAGIRKDTVFIKERTGNFLQALEILLDNIRNHLKTMKTVDTFFDMEAIKQELIELKSAIDAFDATAMNKIVKKLLQLTQGQEMNAVLRKISDDILMSEYDEASTLIEALLIDDFAS